MLNSRGNRSCRWRGTKSIHRETRIQPIHAALRQSERARQYDEQNGMFSPDGHWIAYVSNESGKDEVYVQSFPLSGGKWQISTEGGSEPKWRNDGTELFYIAADRTLMAAPIRKAGAGFEPGAPTRLFLVPLVPYIVSRDTYAVSADGNRFLISRPAGETAATPITVVLNWTAGLKK